jgi:uncharacterized secreted protein with C-terminal beta-propeller domain
LVAGLALAVFVAALFLIPGVWGDGADSGPGGGAAILIADSSGGAAAAGGGVQGAGPAASPGGGSLTPAAIVEGSVVLYVDSPLALVRGREITLDPSDGRIAVYTRKNQAMIPLRFVGEHLGAAVSWDSGSKAITIKAGGRSTLVRPDAGTMWIDGRPVALDTPAEVLGGRAYLPLQAVSQALERTAFYDWGLILLSDSSLQPDPVRDKEALDRVIARVNQLPGVGDAATLRRLLERSDQGYDVMYNGSPVFGMIFDGVSEADSAPGGGNSADGAAPSAAPSAAASPSQSAARGTAEAATAGEAGEFSVTNTQVLGVDEADTVKTDGRYIYQILPGRIAITLANPPERLAVTHVLTLEGENFTPTELYVAGDQLIVVGNDYSGGNASSRGYSYSMAGRVRTGVWIYDITDRSAPVKIREIGLDGNYVSSRKIGDALYLVANQPGSWYYPGGRDAPDVLEGIPSYRDSALSGQNVQLLPKDIRYIPAMTSPNYLLLAAADLSRPTEPVSVSAYLGAGENIYVSQDNLYVAVSHYGDVQPLWWDSAAAGLGATGETSRQGTRILKFSLSGSQITYLTAGQAPGTVLNQFAMDEKDGYLRLAVTEDRWDRISGGRSVNHLYVLDENLDPVGGIEDIAPGERIYSARFMGDRAYMVTFQTVDPLFVIDLKNPAQPKILGALKIPGYSQYLHPYDENHLIGFGKDTVEVPIKGWPGGEQGTTAYYLGLKLALFDVRDVTAPQEKFSVTIGDRGSESELLYNHKAFLFSREKGLLAFPASVAEVRPEQRYQSDVPAYGQFTFQGLYVYNLDLDTGFTLKGRITHLSDEALLKAGNGFWDDGSAVRRGLYIDDTLYTVSNKTLKANDLSTLREIKAVDIPG